MKLLIAILFLSFGNAFAGEENIELNGRSPFFFRVGQASLTLPGDHFQDPSLIKDCGETGNYKVWVHEVVTEGFTWGAAKPFSICGLKFVVRSYNSSFTMSISDPANEKFGLTLNHIPSTGFSTSITLDTADRAGNAIGIRLESFNPIFSGMVEIK